ncbi:alpha-D-ribose 1-methylphosphonate 5-triphosphate synthase subunit PhnG [Yoonia maritima]|uniref:Alpha-D-ribose 1-methylphosphonate 5-triphosphate synthase subunit PhnG n=1 Tax=Yoonia maritima TaxID=1435347 RepID=A0A2T0VYH0_9RHOB|nr:phosphonate C-P lyase system protein PhnG [Yoonia maritima]PRY77242.1 alpha-D-ribose 1-methylphosphonate 5-triphosphate synthase subunit PhnG [Yoonia maritima]
MEEMNDRNAARKAWMSLLAKSDTSTLTQVWGALGIAPDFSYLRAPEIGGVMVRGRAGAVGAAFNLGEMTVTRCSVKLASGVVGHAYVQGRDKEQARIAALVDALMQTKDAAVVQATVIDPLAEIRRSSQASRAAKAAATKVDFFTMVRGED